MTTLSILGSDLSMCPKQDALFFPYNGKYIRLFLIFSFPFCDKKLKLKREYFCYFEADFFQVGEFSEN